MASDDEYKGIERRAKRRRLNTERRQIVRFAEPGKKQRRSGKERRTKKGV